MGFLVHVPLVQAGGDPTGFSLASRPDFVEGNAGNNTVWAATVTLAGVGAGTYSVNYAVTADTADSSDLTLATGTLNYTVNASQHIDVVINGDTSPEDNESFTITLSSPVGTTIAGSTSLSVTIFTDDYVHYQASDELGQLDGSGNVDFTWHTSALTSSGFGFVEDVQLDATHHRLFVLEASPNKRVLIFNLDAENNLIDHTADYVIGQADFASNTGATTQVGLSGPAGLAYDSAGNRLFVIDENASRIMVYDVATISNGEAAINVLGQADFTTGTTASASQSTMNKPLGAVYDAERDYLFVADINNQRVIVYDVAAITDGEAAIHVLGQTLFSASGAGSTTATTLFRPTAVDYDAENSRLFVADRSNNRVIVYDVAAITDGEAAVSVLGQANFTSSTAQTTQNGLRDPMGVAYHAEQELLFVSDGASQNNRVIVYDVAGITDGESAIHLLGASSYTSYYKASVVTVANGVFSTPKRLEIDQENNRLYVPDSSNYRVQIFDFVNLIEDSLVSGETGTAYSETISTESSQGTVTFAVTAGSLPGGLSLSANGEITGTPTTAEIATFTVTATDTNSDITGGDFTDSAEYTITITAGTEPEAPSQGNISGSRPTRINTPAKPVVTCTAFTGYYSIGNRNPEIKNIQSFLNRELGLVLVEDGIYGSKTTQAVHQFQKKYFAEIIAPWKLMTTTGRWFKTTQAKANQLQGCN